MELPSQDLLAQMKQKLEKPPEPEKETRRTSAAMWAAGVSFAAIIILGLLLFLVPAPKGGEKGADGQATTTTETAADVSPQKPAGGGTAKPAAQYPAAGTRLYEKGVYVTVIHYNGKAFVPDAVTVAPGEEVRFINTSANLTMDIGSQPGGVSSPYYAAYNQPTATGKAGTYQVSFPQPGIFSYQNMIGTPAVKGIIYIK